MLPYYIIIPAISACACFLTGIILWPRLLPSLRLLVIEAFMSAAVDVVCYLRFHRYNSAIHNVYCFADFFLLLFATSSLLPASVARRFYMAAGGTFALCWFLFIFVHQKDFNLFANDAVIVSSLLIIVNYLVTLYLCETRACPVNYLSLRLICFSVVIYSCGTFALFVTINRYLTHHNIPDWIGDINTCMDTIRYVLLSLAFITLRRQHLENKNGNEWMITR